MPILHSEFSKHPELEENVAVLVFGEETKFLHYYSNHYAAIKETIGMYHGHSLMTFNIFLIERIDWSLTQNIDANCFRTTWALWPVSTHSCLFTVCWGYISWIMYVLFSSYYKLRQWLKGKRFVNDWHNLEQFIWSIFDNINYYKYIFLFT